MGQKAILNSLRLGVLSPWKSEWFGSFEYSSLISMDFKIREYLNNIFFSLRLPCSDFSIQHYLTYLIFIDVDIYFSIDIKERLYLFKSKDLHIFDSLDFILQYFKQELSKLSLFYKSNIKYFIFYKHICYFLLLSIYRKFYYSYFILYFFNIFTGFYFFFNYFTLFLRLKYFSIFFFTFNLFISNYFIFNSFISTRASLISTTNNVDHESTSLIIFNISSKYIYKLGVLFNICKILISNNISSLLLFKYSRILTLLYRFNVLYLLQYSKIYYIFSLLYRINSSLFYYLFLFFIKSKHLYSFDLERDGFFNKKQRRFLFKHTYYKFQHNLKFLGTSLFNKLKMSSILKFSLSNNFINKNQHTFKILNIVYTSLLYFISKFEFFHLFLKFSYSFFYFFKYLISFLFRFFFLIFFVINHCFNYYIQDLLATLFYFFFNIYIYFTSFNLYLLFSIITPYSRVNTYTHNTFSNLISILKHADNNIHSPFEPFFFNCIIFRQFSFIIENALFKYSQCCFLFAANYYMSDYIPLNNPRLIAQYISYEIEKGSPVPELFRDLKTFYFSELSRRSYLFKRIYRLQRFHPFTDLLISKIRKHVYFLSKFKNTKSFSSYFNNIITYRRYILNFKLFSLLLKITKFNNFLSFFFKSKESYSIDSFINTLFKRSSISNSLLITKYKNQSNLLVNILLTFIRNNFKNISLKKLVYLYLIYFIFIFSKSIKQRKRYSILQNLKNFKLFHSYNTIYSNIYNELSILRNKFVLRFLKYYSIEGMRLIISGTFKRGNEASSKLYAHGRIPKSSISLDVSQFVSPAYTRNGVLGVKVYFYFNTDFFIDDIELKSEEFLEKYNLLDKSDLRSQHDLNFKPKKKRRKSKITTKYLEPQKSRKYSDSYKRYDSSKSKSNKYTYSKGNDINFNNKANKNNKNKFQYSSTFRNKSKSYFKYSNKPKRKY